jgi:prevent-host-death family protein
MDEIVTAAEANRHFSRLLRTVQSGRSVTVTSHGRPVARIVPLEPSNDAEAAERRRVAWRALMDRLKSQPAIEQPRNWTRDELYERD